MSREQGTTVRHSLCASVLSATAPSPYPSPARGEGIVRGSSHSFALHYGFRSSLPLWERDRERGCVAYHACQSLCRTLLGAGSEGVRVRSKK